MTDRGPASPASVPPSQPGDAEILAVFAAREKRRAAGGGRYSDFYFLSDVEVVLNALDAAQSALAAARAQGERDERERWMPLMQAFEALTSPAPQEPPDDGGRG